MPIHRSTNQKTLLAGVSLLIAGLTSSSLIDIAANANSVHDEEAFQQVMKALPCEFRMNQKTG